MMFVSEKNCTEGHAHASISQCFIRVLPQHHNVSYSALLNYTKVIKFVTLSKVKSKSPFNVLKVQFGVCRVHHDSVVNEEDYLKAIQDANIGSLLFKLCACKNGVPDCEYKPLIAVSTGANFKF